MPFNSDVSKQAQEIIFSRKKNINNHPAVFFNNPPIYRKSTQNTLVYFWMKNYIFQNISVRNLKW